MAGFIFSFRLGKRLKNLIIFLLLSSGHLSNSGLSKSGDSKFGSDFIFFLISLTPYAGLQPFNTVSFQILNKIRSILSYPVLSLPNYESPDFIVLIFNLRVLNLPDFIVSILSLWILNLLEFVVSGFSVSGF